MVIKEKSYLTIKLCRRFIFVVKTKIQFMFHLYKFIFFIVIFPPAVIFAGYISNGDFEMGDLTDWTVTVSTSSAFVQAVPPGPALYSNNGLNRVHSGNYSAMLYSSNGIMNHGAWARISRDIVVPPGFTDLQMWFAAVLWGYHYYVNEGYNSDAYVMLEIMQGATIIYNERFSFYDNFDALLPGDMSNPTSPWKYLPWTRIVIPLAPYVGQTLTLRYTAYNCYYSAHQCYGYIDDFDFVLPPSPTPTITETITETVTATITPSHTVSPTNTTTATITETVTPSCTGTITPTFTITPTITPTIIPADLTLYGVFPNPGKSFTNVIYYLTRFADVYFTVYTVSGEEVRKHKMEGLTGYNAWHWDLKNNFGMEVASGVFIIRLEMYDAIYKRKEFAWCKVAIVK